MTTLWIDCKYGIAGDMFLASLIDLGADAEFIIKHLQSLAIDDFKLSTKTVNKLGISAKALVLAFEETNLYPDLTTTKEHRMDGHPHNHDHHHHHEHDHLHHHEHHHEHDHLHHHEHDHHHHHEHHHDHDHHHEHRKASDILNMIKGSDLPQRVKERASAIFTEIARAEGQIHGMDPSQVHFHEVGAMDSILDVIGGCLALESLNIDDIIAVPVPTGHGLMKMAHGLYPIPAPATAEILRGLPLSAFSEKGELTTPTGAAILKVLVNEFKEHPTGIIEKIGYGAGQKDFAHPNVLRTALLKK